MRVLTSGKDSGGQGSYFFNFSRQFAQMHQTTRQRRCHALIHLIIVDQTKAGTRLAPVCQIQLLGTWKVKSATKMDVLPTFLSRRPSPEGHEAYGQSSYWREGEI